MMDIRRIQEHEAEAVTELWDRMCQEVVDGGPLTARGRVTIARLLAVASWHRDQFCLVATEGDRIIGFALARVDAGTGLLPGLTGHVEEFYVTPQSRGRGVAGTLASAAVSRLRSQGAVTVRTQICADAEQMRSFWQGQGFEPDMITLSQYRD
jgi:GNAT superfamily N-acetyltransferase